MSTATESQSSRERSTLYIATVVVLVLLVIGGLIAFRAARSTAKANQKADELIAAIEDAGATAPTRDQIVRVLGEDGGAICADPNKSLTRAVLLSQLANGAAGPGTRPVIADSRAVKGELLVIKTYCPDQLADFQKFVDDLKTSDVAGG